MIENQNPSEFDDELKNQSLVPSQTNRSSSIIYSEPKVIKVSPRKKRRYLNSQNLQSNNNITEQYIINSPAKNGESPQQQTSPDWQKTQSNSQNSKDSSNNETKPGKTIQYQNEEYENNEEDLKPSLKAQYQFEPENSWCQQKIQESEGSVEDESLEQEDDEQEQKIQQFPQQKKQKNILVHNQPIYARIKLNQSFRYPVPQGYRVSCRIRTQSTLFGLNTKYFLYLRNQEKQQKIVSLISAKKQLLALNPTYIISGSEQNHSERSSSYLAKLSGNFSGNQWQLSCLHNINQSKITLRSKYCSSFMGYRSLRAMEAYKFTPNSKQADQNIPLINNLSPNINKKRNLIKIQTTLPVKQKGKYKLNFRGHAKIASTKNFILHYNSDKNEQKQCLLFARQDQKSYIMEVSYPLSVMEGFSLCLTSLNSKLFVN